MIKFSLGVAVLAALMWVLTACGPTDGRHHPHRSPVPTASSASPVFTTAVPTMPPPGHGLIVLADPGRVTYDRQLAAGACHASSTIVSTVLPDPACTPGGVDPNVSQITIKTTICVSGYTRTVRPPLGETAPLKRAQYIAYGVPAGTVTELDHLVPLELGGDNTVSNLWPEFGPTSGNPKDTVENDLHAAVCSGRVKLADAQLAIAQDWVTAEHVLGLK